MNLPCLCNRSVIPEYCNYKYKAYNSRGRGYKCSEVHSPTSPGEMSHKQVDVRRVINCIRKPKQSNAYNASPAMVEVRVGSPLWASFFLALEITTKTHAKISSIPYPMTITRLVGWLAGSWRFTSW